MENKDIGDYGIERNETTLIKMLKVQVKLGSGNRIIWIRGAKNPARRMFFEMPNWHLKRKYHKRGLYMAKKEEIIEVV